MTVLNTWSLGGIRHIAINSMLMIYHQITVLKCYYLANFFNSKKDKNVKFLLGLGKPVKVIDKFDKVSTFE